MADTCCVCGRAEDKSLDARGMFKVELRPYGPQGASICFECGTRPERKAETGRQFAGRLALAGPQAILTPQGPAPASGFIRDMAKPNRRRS